MGDIEELHLTTPERYLGKNKSATENQRCCKNKAKQSKRRVENYKKKEDIP